MKYDLIVVTAANLSQAKLYEAQLKGRKRYLVMPDPGGERVGSLGATVNVLKNLSGITEKSKILICHSGGDSKRTIAYAANGKAFVPMKDSRPIIDHIVDEMEKLPDVPGVMVCCGDVVTYLDFKKVKFADGGVTGVAYPDGAWQAARHGVYVADTKGTGLKKVIGFRQKPKVKGQGHLIDTGIMHIDIATAKKMRELPVRGDIYEDFPKMLLEGFSPFYVSVVSKCDFFHIGSSRELLSRLGDVGSYNSRPFSLIDGCKARIVELGGDNIVTNVPREYGEISLKKGECLTSLPLGKDEWFHIKYHIDDSFKDDGLWDKYDLSKKMLRVNPHRLLELRSRKLVRASSPARVDLSGGWSDTPPICYREGGAVLSAAVTLDGERPIEVAVSERKDNFVKIVSKDLRKQRLVKSAAEIADHHDPHDWCALVKSALTVTGFKFGERGINVVISANLPKGSGLGTSSILGATTIAALLRRNVVSEVGALTLALEKEMCTGGGWQDQFAGITPGVKLMTSSQGEDQKIAISAVENPEVVKALRDRSLLYFTGQKRMARNILRKVIGFYEENPHNFAKILIASLKDTAREMKAAFDDGNVERIASLINDYWRDKKLLDPNSTNERVDAIIKTISPWISAVSLCGAGGGGFVYILAKDKKSVLKIKAALEKNPPTKYSRFYKFDFDFRGLELG